MEQINYPAKNANQDNPAVHRVKIDCNISGKTVIIQAWSTTSTDVYQYSPVKIKNSSDPPDRQKILLDAVMKKISKAFNSENTINVRVKDKMIQIDQDTPDAKASES